MNREIKFRIWNATIKYFVQNIEGGVASFTLSNLTDYLQRNSIVNIDGFVFPQYTGLKDVNRKEIYEGDIVEVRSYEDWNDEDGFNVTYIVGWCKRHVGFRGFKRKMIDLGYSGHGLPEPIKVIGNIFENPELLKTT
jgi:uncharacterized phage protein (TIGR01671 family)